MGEAWLLTCVLVVIRQADIKNSRAREIEVSVVFRSIKVQSLISESDRLRQTCLDSGVSMF